MFGRALVLLLLPVAPGEHGVEGVGERVVNESAARFPALITAVDELFRQPLFVEVGPVKMRAFGAARAASLYLGNGDGLLVKG